MTKRVRISALVVALLLITCLGGAWVDVHAQATAGQKLNADGAAALQRIINSAQHPDLRWPDFPPYQQEVKEFYTRTGGTLGWVRDRKPTPQATAMIALFCESDHKGLVPEDYDAPRWPARLQKLNGSASDADLANFDAAMTVSTMRYIRALHVGRVNPKTLGRKLDVDNQKYDVGEFVCDKIISASDPAAVVKTVEPTFPGYLRTLDALHSCVSWPAVNAVEGRDRAVQIVSVSKRGGKYEEDQPTFGSNNVVGVRYPWRSADSPTNRAKGQSRNSTISQSGYAGSGSKSEEHEPEN